MERDYLELDYWEDIVNLIGAFDEHRPSTRPRAPHYRVVCVCVDLTWSGKGEVFPRGAPAAERTPLLIARVNQNHFVPLLRVLGDAGATLSGNPGSSGDASRASDSAGKPSGDASPPSAGAGTEADTGRSSLGIRPRKKAKLCGAFGDLYGKGGQQ